MTSIPFDICVLTAANEAQAQGYRQQIDWRQHESMLPETDFRVIADPDGKRIGSGGSTFYVLNELFAEYGDALFSKRTLILHSGGDSRRLPAYSAVGKIFMPLPTEEHRTLFDVMLDNYSTLPNPSGGQVVIASGDVLLNFDPAFIDFSASGVTGVAYSENPSEGQFFGVYVVKEPQSTCVPAIDMLQKPTLETLRQHDAIDAAHRIWIDTGILNLAPDAIKTWLQCEQLIHASKAAAVNYNLYHEILYAMHGKVDIEDSHLLNTLSVHVNCLPYCGFYHVGKSTDLLQNFYTLTHASVHYHFQNAVRSNAALYPELKSAWVYNSVIESEQIAVEKPCLIEGCFIRNSLKLDGHNIVTNITQNVGPIHLRKGSCLNLLPLENGRWVAVLYGIDDAFKDPNATFLNQSFVDFKNENNIADHELWSGAEAETLWTAQLFPVGDHPADVVECALKLDQHELPKWRQASRLSMADILVSVDQIQLLKNHSAIREKNIILNLDDHLLKENFDFDSLKKCIHTKADKNKVTASLERAHQKPDNGFLTQARAHFWMAQLLEGADAETHIARSFASIRQAVASGANAISRIESDTFGIRSDEVVWTTLPARLDFAGGWTDTPPVCLERGGNVLNASVTLNGQYPIQVVGKITPGNYTISVNSIDLGQRTTIDSFDELRDFSNPAEWLSLPKAACFAAGLFDEQQSDLQSILKKMGGGIDLTLFSALPAGSGLGTSSILGAGLIATLSRLMGIDIQRHDLYARTSNLEQLMTTGGGWQDQIGGVAGGVKLISTQPGYNQSPQLSWTRLKQPGVELGDHFLLYYTGIRRMAKNLLRQVVGRYLNRDRQAVDVLTHLAHLAADMKTDLDHRRLDTFGQKIGQAWRLNTTLDAGQSTPDIDHVLSQIDDFILGAKLLGAGGGGFLFIAAKDKQAAQRIRKELVDNPPNDRARFFDFDVDPVGMRVSVL